jgi:hypothetical protein
LFQFLQTSYVTRINFFFDKSSQQEVWAGDKPCAAFERSWSDQLHSNQGDLDSRTTGKVGSVYYTRVDVTDFVFAPQNVVTAEVLIKFYIVYYNAVSTTAVNRMMQIINP